MRPMTVVSLLVLTGVATLGIAQSDQQPAAQKSLSATMTVYVFPTEGQDAAQQSKEEAECYQWAVQNTGVDPFDLAKTAEQQQQQADQAQQEIAQAGQGAGVKGAVGGAAAGALIGEIANDDAGKGAAYGAAAGAIVARRRTRAAKARASQEAARALDIPVTGLDFLVPDVTASDYVIIEANERPGLANHEPQPTAERFVDLLFPQTATREARA